MVECFDSGTSINEYLINVYSSELVIDLSTRYVWVDVSRTSTKS